MPLNRRRYQLWLIGGTLVAGLYVFSQLATGSTPMLLMSPVLEALHAPANWWQSATLWFSERRQLQSDYMSYRIKVEQQAALIQEANSLREENRQLRNILDIAGMPGYRWHAAKVRGRSPESMSRRLVLEVNGVSRDDVIVSSEGLVGVVDSTMRDHATVRTIFDASLAVPVTIPGTALAALARGQGNSIAIDFIPVQMAPRRGEVLFTSGAGGLFPPGIAVARITNVEPIAGRLFVQTTAEPAAHWQRDNWLAVASQLHAGP
ncbi:rod shape-determining protein MreC [Mariprofundus ferrooxydans]|uniref:Cell shape-determining protein MreC n=1 Tax=Mariprofundus ferrooxydans PV-1 TaxID=314345 RepID=Q0EWL1_9PROT|nr:rod shape-determining protein MreC [Mariprofundus ferrooxydans]EAU53666.1 putative rod shape-determining protein [Mariprofundus ferrooxydans PV-1]KON47293.1 rod shape-determining protein [Mariprofundus ferrooxydans]